MSPPLPGPYDRPARETGGPAPVPDLAPHSPVPGTGYRRALGAAAGWAVVNLVLVVALAGPPPSLQAAGTLVGALLIAAVLAALPTWAVARRRGVGRAALAALALPFFVLVRLVTGLL